MQKKSLTLNVESRDSGKSVTKKLRRKNLVPAVIYGPKIKNHCLYISYNDAVKYTSHKYDNVIFKLQGENKELQNVHALIKSIDRHPVKHNPTHIDFYAPNMSEMIRVNVELHFEGKSVGLQEGGVLSIIRRNVEIECLPTEIPEFFTIDTSELDINQSLKISDIKLPEKMKLITPETETIATMSVVTEEEEAPAPEEAEAVEASAGEEGAEASSKEEKTEAPSGEKSTQDSDSGKKKS